MIQLTPPTLTLDFSDFGLAWPPRISSFSQADIHMSKYYLRRMRSYWGSPEIRIAAHKPATIQQIVSHFF